MSNVEQPCYTLINFPTDSEPYNEMQLKHDLAPSEIKDKHESILVAYKQIFNTDSWEKGEIKKKIEALKKVIGIILSGERIPGLLMIIIRFVLPLQDHTIKKLLLIFWEIVPKTSPDGKLLQEMILVCDSYRKDLQHPNEFIRGSTLRFLCKLKEPELLEPLMPAIRACLDHRHSYVRRNAVLAIFTIYRNFEFLIPDAPELVANFLENEQDMSCKRNAFLMLLHVDQERALTYLSSRLDSVHTFGDILQLVIVELIYKVCVSASAERARFVRVVYALVSAGSAAVRYEAAGTLLTLSHAPHAIKAAAQCYIDLIAKESDNNVKLIVLNRLAAIREECGDVADRPLAELAMDILTVLQATDLEVRKRTLDLVLRCVSSRDAEELVSVLSREAARAPAALQDAAPAYTQLLVHALHRATTKFPEVAGTVAPALLDLVGEGNEPAARDVMVLLREHLHIYPHLQATIYEKLVETVYGIKSPSCARAALWLIAQFADTRERLETALTLFERALADETTLSEEEKDVAVATAPEAPRQLVTSDGTYATQSAFSAAQSAAITTSPYANIRSALLSTEPFTGACAASALTKLALSANADVSHRNRALALIAALLANRQGTGKDRLTADDVEHISCCIAACARPNNTLTHALVDTPRAALSALLADSRAESAEAENRNRSKKTVDVEAPIIFPQLAGAGANATQHDIFEVALSKAVDGRAGGISLDRTGLSSVRQLTGFSDPVYAEAIVSVNQYDILLDVLLLNQTDDTLQNCCVELATMGDLRLVERPTPVVLAPRDYATIKAHVKVASTENGVIFGNIVYEVSGGGERGGVVVLNDVHIDIVEYIEPASCADADFRRMWAEFEWENKVSVNTNITDLKEYLDHLLASTNMKCLTPEKALSGQCGFMAANMYARSIFGEDALANLSIEKSLGKPNAPVVGHVRIRAKSQGMALSLGDKINLMQKATIKQSPAIPAA